MAVQEPVTKVYGVQYLYQHHHEPSMESWVFRTYDEALVKFHDAIRKRLLDIDPSGESETSSGESETLCKLIQQIDPDRKVSFDSDYDELKAVVTVQLRDNLEQFLMRLSNGLGEQLYSTIENGCNYRQNGTVSCRFTLAGDEYGEFWQLIELSSPFEHTKFDPYDGN